MEFEGNRSLMVSHSAATKYHARAPWVRLVSARRSSSGAFCVRISSMVISSNRRMRSGSSKSARALR